MELPDTKSHVVYNRRVMSSSFIIHAPASSYELQSSLINKILDNILHRLTLFTPPPPEEGRFNVDEPALLILQQGMDDTVQDVLDSSSLNIISAAVVILINSLQPSNIIVSVGNKVNIE